MLQYNKINRVIGHIPIIYKRILRSKLLFSILLVLSILLCIVSATYTKLITNLYDKNILTNLRKNIKESILNVKNLSQIIYLDKNKVEKIYYIKSSIENDQIYLSTLSGLCHTAKLNDQSVPIIRYDSLTDDYKVKNLTYKNDLYVLKSIAECGKVDIYLPSYIRNHGYCEDAVAYAKYLHGRLLPEWVFMDIESSGESGIRRLKNTTKYFSFCPDTPLLFFNHYWDNIPLQKSWPKTKQVYLMPNLEMYDLNEKHLYNSNLVICKTKDCYERASTWYQEQGNIKNTRVVYAKHTTSDITALHRQKLKLQNIEFNNNKTTQNNFGSTIKSYEKLKFLHIPGKSPFKGTDQILKCWSEHPGLPMLEIISVEEHIKNRIKNTMGTEDPANVKLINKDITPLFLAEYLSNATIILCPSIMEGYGHYINQARAAGSLVITTNSQPMNELIDGTSGILVDINGGYIIEDKQILGPSYHKGNGLKHGKPIMVKLLHDDVCNAVFSSITMTTKERIIKSYNARQRFEDDFEFFIQAMNDIVKLQK